MNTEQQQLIWKYVEGNCNLEEEQTINALKNTNPEYAQFLEDALSIHNSLKETATQKVSVDFTEKVLQKLSASSNRSVYNGIGKTPLIAFILCTTVYILANAQKIGMLPSQLTTLLEEQVFSKIPQVVIAIPTFDSYTIYIILCLAGIPMLYFLDQIIQKRGVSRLGMFMLT